MTGSTLPYITDLESLITLEVHHFCDRQLFGHLHAVQTQLTSDNSSTTPNRVFAVR